MSGKGRRILWQGKPKKSAFIANKVLAMLPFALLWAAVDVAFVVLVFVLDAPTVMQWIVVAFVCLHLLPFWIWLIQRAHGEQAVQKHALRAHGQAHHDPQRAGRHRLSVRQL